VADTLQKLQLSPKYIKAIAYDLNFNSFPETIRYFTAIPLIYFYQAGKKMNGPIKYEGAPVAGEILKFIEQHSGFEFEFPFDVSYIGTSKERF
jgi:hypothetical protein